MSIIPDDEMKTQRTFNLAPMVDFLFLIIAVFAILTVTRTVLYDSEVNLVKGAAEKVPEILDSEPISGSTIMLSINETGQYKWITEFNEFLIHDANTIIEEIHKQQQLGLLPLEKEKIKILLHIDKNAKWQSIAQVIFLVKEAGYIISPVYEPENN